MPSVPEIFAFSASSFAEPVEGGKRPPEEQRVAGIRFHCLTLEDALAEIERFIEAGVPRQIMLANAYTVSLCRHDADLRTIANKADLTLADGMSIVWGSRWIGSKIPSRVAGPDLMVSLCDRAVQRRYRVYLLGSTPENVKDLSAALKQKRPALDIVGAHSPSVCSQFSEAETEDILRRIAAAKPDILFVGMSCPKQEKWIAANLYRLPVPVSLGVGAAFDFLSGRIPRAPQMLQKIGLEWLYRLYREPRRLWRRYLLGNAFFLAGLIGEWAEIHFRAMSIFGRKNR